MFKDLKDRNVETFLMFLINFFSGFHQLINDPGVEIMSDLEEGICGWMTVNFLLDLVGSTGRQTDR